MKILLHVTSENIWPQSGLSTVNITIRKCKEVGFPQNIPSCYEARVHSTNY